MKGAIFHSTTYGSTAEYAQCISESTGLSAFNVKDKKADPSHYDFLELGSPTYYYKMRISDGVILEAFGIAQKKYQRLHG